MKQQSLKARKYRERMHGLIDFNALPPLEQWTPDPPEQNQFYLVYRLGCAYDDYRLSVKPHYTIRKFHNGSFGSGDVRYWVKLSEVPKLATNQTYEQTYTEQEKEVLVEALNHYASYCRDMYRHNHAKGYDDIAGEYHKDWLTAGSLADKFLTY